jgi:GT2 family glycosyltransferase|tara:strand:+ start:3459 stop:4325 length:867 start_codon:yes stop_codon:yes gene_type:complete
LTILNNTTIIIVLYQESDELVLRSLEKIKNFKIIIFDNADNKILKNKIISKYKIDKYILSKKNVGFSAGYNKAIKFCTTKFIFIKNSDCIIDQNNILKLYDYLNLDEECMIVSPTSYDKNHNLTFCSDNLPENNSQSRHLDLHGNVCVQSVLGAAMFMRMNDFKKIEMFNENLFIYFSDFDLCRKVNYSKKSVVQLFDSICVHTHGEIKAKNYFKRVFLREHYFTLDKLYYFYQINLHDDLINDLQKKIKNYIFKMILSFFTLNTKDIIKYYSWIYAYFKFKKFLKKN